MNSSITISFIPRRDSAMEINVHRDRSRVGVTVDERLDIHSSDPEDIRWLADALHQAADELETARGLATDAVPA